MSDTTAIMTIGEMQSLATAIAQSGLFGLKTPQQALALMAISQAEGRPAALAARDYDVIQGKPVKKAEAMLRDFIAAGGRVEWHTLDDTKADATFSHPAGGSFRCEWTMATAKKAGLGDKDNWKKYPRQMLRSRCVSEGVRTVYPAATSGMYVPEEAAEFTERTVQGEVVNDDAAPQKRKPVTVDSTTTPVMEKMTYEDWSAMLPKAETPDDMRDLKSAILHLPESDRKAAGLAWKMRLDDLRGKEAA